MSFLAIETSTERGSIAVIKGQTVVFEEHFAADRSCGSVLFGVLERAVALGAPEAVVVGLGPGSYSGVRIAIAAAIGLSFGTKARLIGVPSIVAICDGKYVAAGDARRESFHFAEVHEGACVQGPLLLSAEELEAKALETGLPIYGGSPIGCLPRLETRFPEARRLASLAARGISIVGEEELEPIYLRDPHITQAKPVRLGK